jgi:D-glycero-alpha-D-manno-heptose 1-phosphate guanylyltransferase
MAPVNGLPFLHYVFKYLEEQNCQSIILSLGYMHEVILNWLEQENPFIPVSYVIEQEPLGTGGGIRLAMEKAGDEHVVVLNGDTMFRADLSQLLAFHNEKDATTTLALKPMQQFERYGSVCIDEHGLVRAFEEKKFRSEGLINGGVYAINRKQFMEKRLPPQFSFEKDYLEAFVAEGRFYGRAIDKYFIDIGIPEDYQQAQKDFKTLFT